MSAPEGGNITIKVHMVLQRDLTENSVDVTRPDLKRACVHEYRNRRSYLSSQSPQYRGRTTFDDEHLHNGTMVLIISNVTWADSGLYRFVVPPLGVCTVRVSVVNDSRTTEPPETSSAGTNHHGNHSDALKEDPLWKTVLIWSGVVASIVLVSAAAAVFFLWKSGKFKNLKCQLRQWRRREAERTQNSHEMKSLRDEDANHAADEASCERDV
ncbi:uncharacterized protein LOC121509071 [Cheilinus undulatus]|uniref:uncharacterized protein LOC121509071 n=1 Tax=Cheilinus undulatus TaxID=241271 RepID=UPI001BD68620|nr:uncharacterized protein LOC121509071 [Cheilinus undulatus]